MAEIRRISAIRIEGFVFLWAGVTCHALLPREQETLVTLKVSFLRGIYVGVLAPPPEKKEQAMRRVGELEYLTSNP